MPHEQAGLTQKRRFNSGAGWVGGGWSNVILDPTLALIRAQLGFRIQVRAECGNLGLALIGLLSSPLILTLMAAMGFQNDRQVRIGLLVVDAGVTQQTTGNLNRSMYL